jgi:trans-2,3-dihydro-3-hydroxyanthranilate isomerase
MVTAITSSQTLDYQIVDVFTETVLEGNGLAVVFDNVGLSTERMQAIAREFNLSETTFIQRRDPETEAREGVRVRIFTTQEELPFAGHPTLGTASVLKISAPETISGDTIKLALNVGPVPVRFKADSPFRGDDPTGPGVWR